MEWRQTRNRWNALGGTPCSRSDDRHRQLPSRAAGGHELLESEERHVAKQGFGAGVLVVNFSGELLRHADEDTRALTEAAVLAIIDRHLGWTDRARAITPRPSRCGGRPGRRRRRAVPPGPGTAPRPPRLRPRHRCRLQRASPLRRSARRRPLEPMPRSTPHWPAGPTPSSDALPRRPPTTVWPDWARLSRWSSTTHGRSSGSTHPPTSARFVTHTAAGSVVPILTPVVPWPRRPASTRPARRCATAKPVDDAPEDVSPRSPCRRRRRIDVDSWYRVDDRPHRTPRAPRRSRPRSRRGGVRRPPRRDPRDRRRRSTGGRTVGGHGRSDVRSGHRGRVHAGAAGGDPRPAHRTGGRRIDVGDQALTSSTVRMPSAACSRRMPSLTSVNGRRWLIMPSRSSRPLR